MKRHKNFESKGIIKKLNAVTEKLVKEKKGSEAEYAELQLTWNKDILERSIPHIPQASRQIMGIGAFMGTTEIALSPYVDKAVCVDFKSFLPKWKPSNVKFHKANIDSSDWKLPIVKDNRYDAIFLIETIEHLLWSPVPLLKWMSQNCHTAVVSTPDDEEWPPMEIHPWSRYMNYKNIPPAAPGVKSNPLPMFHCKQYNQAEFIDLLNFCGFRVLEFFRTGDGKHQMVAILQPR